MAGVFPLQSALTPSGFNAFGVIEASAYDAMVAAPWRSASLLPGAASVVVLATGGRAFFSTCREAFASGEVARDSEHPVDTFTEARVQAAAAACSEQGFDARPVFYWERRGDPASFADFVSLGRAAGLGTPSRLGLLLHPEFGPWMAIRALCLTTHSLPATAAIDGAGACEGCTAPCSLHCPVDAPALTGFDAVRCRNERERDVGCRLRCSARHACVIGQEHAHDADAEAHHMLAASVLPVERPSK